ncbi:MAG TPA: FtsX-like permease family protein, partial [Longimicrobiales bacterium]|nr:FtsX-like permease family protein [Longimicrobiales bacterium]
YDNSYVYGPLAAAQDLLHLEDGVGAIGVNLEDPWASEAAARWIDEELGFPYYTNDWVQLNASLFSALKLEKLAMGIILFLIVVVAAFNIISTLIMAVADKTREIGILKSMGMQDRTVLRIFMLQGLTIGVVGTVLGTGLGLFLVWLLDTYQFIELPGDVYFLDSLPVALNWTDLAMIIGVSVLVAFAATIYPARQASRLLPVDAIRHE